MADDATRDEELRSLRELQAPTRRATVPALEDVLYQPLRVLDHGFVRVVDYMGDDAAIVQAARVSYGRGTKQVSSDRGLINYLIRHRHSSPLEMCEIKLHVKLPIFVARQWIRHRTANVNEYSARYSVLDREFYVPDADLVKLVKAPRRPGVRQERLFELPGAATTAAQSTTNRQGREAVLERDAAAGAIRAIKRTAETAFTAYERLLGDDPAGDGAGGDGGGVARELARVVLPLATYTQMYWKIDLHNLLHFVRLRADGHAQAEIRAYALVLLDVLRRWVPLTLAAFEEHRLNGAELSATALALLRRRLRGEPVDRAGSGLSAREWRELVALLPELGAAD
jgi:thymidylate synthase (FAD)